VSAAGRVVEARKVKVWSVMVRRALAALRWASSSRKMYSCPLLAGGPRSQHNLAHNYSNESMIINQFELITLRESSKYSSLGQEQPDKAVGAKNFFKIFPAT
jgi:hypothetical protein